MRRSFLFLVLSLFVTAPTSAQPDSNIEALLIGTPRDPNGGTTESAHVSPRAINARGQVAGTYTWYPEPGFGGPENRWAFVWTRTRGFTVIAQNAEALDINDNGQVVGQYWPCQPPMPEEGSPCQHPRGFLWSASRGFLDLGTMLPVAINNAGRIAGHCSTGSCLRYGTTTRSLPARFVVDDLNERGVAAGLFQRQTADGDFVFRSAVWTASTGVRELSSPLPRGRAFAINEGGIVVGSGDDGTRSFAMVWTPFGGIAAPAGPDSHAAGVSDRGWIVGIANQRPALWRVGERLTRLPTPTAPDAHGGAADVNDAGQIVGEFATENGNRGVLWTVR